MRGEPKSQHRFGHMEVTGDSTERELVEKERKLSVVKMRMVNCFPPFCCEGVWRNEVDVGSERIFF